MKLTLSIPGAGGTPMQIDSGLPKGVPTGGLDMGSNIIGVFIDLILIGAILSSLYYILRGGINMMTSGGDKQKFQSGRERVRYALIGLVIIFLSFFAINTLGRFFGLNLLSFYK